MDRAVDILKTYFNIEGERYHEYGGINKDTLMLIGGVCFAKILLIDIIFGRSGQLICHFIAFVYPAYRTTKAIESRHNGGEDGDSVQWLMYWVVFAIFHLIEFFSDTILGWLPMYWMGKCIFLIGCMSPLNLSSVIYHLIVLPAFKKNEAVIDDVVHEYRECLLSQCKKYVGSENTCILPAVPSLTCSVLPETLDENTVTNNTPRMSPKKKRAPPPPKVLKMNDEYKIDEYLNEHF